MSSRLPGDVNLKDLDWDEAIGYLETICEMSGPVMIEGRDGAGVAYLETRGHLSPGGCRLEPRRHWYRLNWPGREDTNGTLTIARDDFQSAWLSTIDGATFFGLVFLMEDGSIAVGDDNYVAGEWPTPKAGTMKRPGDRITLDELPTAAEVRADFKATADNPVTQEIVAELSRLRASLVEAGVAKAEAMSVFELSAAASRAIWRLQDEGVVSREEEVGEFEKLWVVALAEDLLKD